MLKIHSAFFIGTVSLVTFMALSVAAGAQEPSFDVKGSIDAFTRSAAVDNATDLVPSPSEAGYRKAYRGVESTLQVTTRIGALTLGSQLRIAADGESKTDLHVDEAYAELLLGEHVFAFAGRRIRTWGQSFGLNPADVFQDPLRENAVFRQSQARTRIKGVDMVGADIMFDSGGTLTLLYAPSFDRRDNGRKEDFALARFSGLAFDGSLDYAISAVGGHRPGVGLSLGRTVGDASVVYLDGTFRKGREKRTIAAIDTAGTLTLRRPEADVVKPYVTLGFGHAFGNGLSMNLEYTHDAGGYSRGEWGQIASALDQVTPVSSGIHGRTLGQLNGLLDHYTLRRNYAFGRLAHDGLLGGKLAAELTVLHSLDDGSGVLGVRLEYPVVDQFTLGLKASHRYGAINTEFTLRPETGSIAVYTSIRF